MSHRARFEREQIILGDVLGAPPFSPDQSAARVTKGVDSPAQKSTDAQELPPGWVPGKSTAWDDAHGAGGALERERERFLATEAPDWAVRVVRAAKVPEGGVEAPAKRKASKTRGARKAPRKGGTK